ncbi:Ig-like domain-containing protein [Cohnella lubricantis]|uniref:Ig-like domain-containing protein n=1 Tax=Cohnella lubricantis TaxID=2163172 RepID=A0A841TG03_9BACL|nr:Ig-like domain-containing protein [Cohnella lubricantis]MBB6679035.1 Ig-like domain-containing protein [Cohnella lubricantis]MBP2120240.1 methionine-rich copper-binding protein CopC [Cohnella lubricantis]
MALLRRTLMFVLMVALILPAWSAAGAAQTLTTEQKYDVLKQKGIFTGFEDGSARLDSSMTREQFAAVLFRLWGMEEEQPSKASYDDVLRSRWSFGEIEAVSQAGLMNGMGNRKFSPASNVTIEQLATILVRAYGYSGSGTVVTGKVSAWARASVGNAVNQGYIPPQTDYTVPATRALLVEAAYAAYQQMIGGQLDVKAVQPLSNNVIQVTLNKAISSIDLSHFSLRNEQGGTVPILNAALTFDGMIVTITTGTQVESMIHTLYIDGEGWRYTSQTIDNNDDDNRDRTRPSIVKLTNSQGLLQVTFSERVNESTATDSDNYDILSGGLDLLWFDLSDDGKTVSIGTSRQDAGERYRLSVSGVRDLAGNVMSTRSDLYFTGLDDRTKPTVASVASQSNSTVKVVFSEKVDRNDAQDTRNYQLSYDNQNQRNNRNNNGLRINRATLADDGRTVTLYTSELNEDRQYSLTIRDIADLSGNTMDTKTFSFTYDRIKPFVQSVQVLENSVLSVKFSEKVNEAQAENRGNYSIDNGLTVQSAYLENGDTVLLTTSKQRDATLYRLTVRGISDLSGNVMETQSDLLFGGLVDRTPPTVTAISAGSKKIELTFNERLDSGTANRAANYRLDGSLSVTGAQYDDAKRTVTISTGDQTPGKVYTLTINNVKDLSGLPITANTSLQFVGAASAAGSIALQAIAVVDQNTVQVTFNRALYDEDVRQLRLAVVKDNGQDLSNNGWQSYVSRKSGSDNIVTVQFRTDKSNNPALFLPSHVYTGKVSGINGLVTKDGADQKPFAGTETANRAPYVTQAKALNRGAVQVTFSEPVRNIGPEGFRIFRNDGHELVVGSDSLNNRGAIVTEAVLYLEDDLQSGYTYRLQPQASITDAAGWNAIQTRTSDGNPYEVTFAGTSAADTAPRITQVVSNDRYTFSVSFSEPVRIGDGNGFTVYNSTDREDVNIDKRGYAVYVPSGDRKSLTVYLNAETGQMLESGKRYVLRLDTNETWIADDQGTPLQGVSSSGTIEVAFTSRGADQSGPAISKVEARGSLILVTFNEAITGYSNQTDFFDIRIAGKDVKPTSGSLQGQTVVLKVPEMTSGQIGTIRVSSKGADAIRDYNRLRAATDEVVFGVQ